MSGFEFERTPEAIEQHFSLARHRQGVHNSSKIGTGLGNRLLGHAKYNPLRHSPLDINYRSFAGMVEDEDYVRVVTKTMPVDLHIVRDGTLRSEVGVAKGHKSKVADQVARGIGDSVTSITDKLFEVAVSETYLPGSSKGRDTVRVFGREDLPAAVEENEGVGLTFVMSDFKGISFQEGSLEDTIAIKINHLLEREVPQGIGRITLGSVGDLDTNNRRKLRAYNQHLQHEHDGVVEQLQAAGAHVVSIVANPRIQPFGFDALSADTGIANAVIALDD